MAIRCISRTETYRVATGTGKNGKYLNILELISVPENILEILLFYVFKYSSGNCLKMYCKILEFETQ